MKPSYRQTSVLSIRLRPVERAIVEALARDRGVDVSTFCRSVILSQEHPSALDGPHGATRAVSLGFGHLEAF